MIANGTSPFRRFLVYLSLIRFSHTVFALPFALIGFSLGFIELKQKGIILPFQWPLFVKMLLCMVFARSAAMAFNRYLDRHYDALNPRTAKREIPAGIIKPQHALVFTIVNSLLFVLTTWFINTACFYLSFIALFVTLFYSYTKRFTALCHLVLGLGLALAPIGAFLAVTGYFALLPVLFSASVLTWVAGFDIIYALQDENFDRSNKLHSIPAALGVKKALLVSVVLHFLTAATVIAAGIIGRFHWVYWCGAASYIAMLVYQHLLVKPGDLSKVNIAFANTNGIAGVLFAIFTIISFFV
ncbi:MAG: 4-hydroxybenzoate octaprenyltransferase [Flavipsychrobacter sp.]|jgi:4-hydroxybenzoate polyprenyltransferase|nr:4-hydroxybenzoate octaprenyltransferase [Flavipsychrobacter sp.]